MTIYHLHHIIPKHVGGSDDPANIIKLTVEEHAEAHKKLWEEHGRPQDRIAWLMLSGQLGNEELFIERSRIGGYWHKGKNESLKTREAISKGLTGKPCPESKKQSISKSNSGKVRTEEVKKRISETCKRLGIRPKTHGPGKLNPFFGKKHSEETKRKISETKRRGKLNKSSDL